MRTAVAKAKCIICIISTITKAIFKIAGKISSPPIKE